MKHLAGFTLIEMVVFIIVTGILLSTIMLGAVTAMKNTPAIHQQWIAIQTARTCMEWFLDQIALNGYATFACPSTPSASACTAPSGYSVATNVACTTWNSDANYKTITVTVSGLATASLATQVGNS